MLVQRIIVFLPGLTTVHCTLYSSLSHRVWRDARSAHERGVIAVIPRAASSSSGSGGVAAPPPITKHFTFLKEVEQIFPVEEPEPAGLNAVLRSYQKQSLAFMLRNERLLDSSEFVGKDRDGNTARGGFLADEGESS